MFSSQSSQSNDAAKYNDFLVTEANDTHLEEVKMLLGFKLARLQRQGLSEEQISEKIDIQNLRFEVVSLESKLTRSS
jgi:hypothetical protein